MTIFGLQVATGIIFDGSNEHDGAFRVYGGTGNDMITGGTGDDWLFGGDGGDTLTGGAGSDTFYYDDVAQSTDGRGATGSWTSASGDKIDVSGIDAIAGGGNDAFTFLGSGAFTNHAGELRVVRPAAGRLARPGRHRRRRRRRLPAHPRGQRRPSHHLGRLHALTGRDGSDQDIEGAGLATIFG